MPVSKYVWGIKPRITSLTAVAKVLKPGKRINLFKAAAKLPNSNFDPSKMVRIDLQLRNPPVKVVINGNGTLMTIAANSKREACMGLFGHSFVFFCVLFCVFL